MSLFLEKHKRNKCYLLKVSKLNIKIRESINIILLKI